MSHPSRPTGGGLGQVRNVIAAIATSAFGTFAYNVGIAVYTYDETHSAAWVAAVTVGRYIPALLVSWLASGLVDRLPRRAVAIGADLVCGLVMLLLALLASHHAAVLIMALVAAASSSLARLQAASVQALAADIVLERHLARASVLAGAAEAVAAATGSAAASAVLATAGTSVLFVLNAATFFASAGLLAGVRSVRPQRSAPGRAQEPAPVPTRAFRPLQAARTVAALVNGMDVVLLTVIAAEQLHDGSAAYGWLLGAAGLGGLIAVLPARRLQTRATSSVATGGLLIYALPLAAFAASPATLGAVALQILRGGGSVVANSTVMAALQRAVPSAVSGRVFGATQSLVLCGTCAGAVLAPALIDAVGLETALVLAAILPVAAQMLLFPALRRFDREEGELLAALDPRVSTLRRLDLLQDASRSTLYAIADGIEDVRVEPDTVVVAEGDPSDAFYVLVDGAVEAFGTGPDGPVWLRRMDALDHFGEIGLLHGVERTATVTAAQECELWRIPAHVFLAAVAEAGVSGALNDTTQMRLTTAP